MASISKMWEQAETAAQELQDEHGEDWQEYIGEKADFLVPCYNHDVIKEWECVPTFDSEDYIGDHDIINQMKWVLYEWYQMEILDAGNALLGDA